MAKLIQVSLLIMLSFLLLSSFYVSMVAGQNNAYTAKANIASTKTAISNCYTAVKEAEAEGAKVSVLIDNLNVAGKLLTQAELAYSAKDYVSAANFASKSKDSLSGFNVLAVSLKETATQNRKTGLFTNYVLGIAALAVFCAGLVSWVFLSKKTKRSDVVDEFASV